MNKLIFYITSAGRRKLRFEQASDLDYYIRNHKMPKDAKITLMSGKLIVGSMMVKRYMELEKEEEKRK